MKPKNKVDKQPAFLAAFKRTCSITEAAEAIGIDRGAHYDWLRNDPDYVIAYEEALPEARDLLKDVAVRISRRGTFEPFTYKGRPQYATRRRVMCKLSTGESAFEDELPKGAKVIERRTVATNDGEPLGIWRVDSGRLGQLLAAWLPEFGAKLELTGKDGEALIPSEFHIHFADGEDGDIDDDEEILVSPEA